MVNLQTQENAAGQVNGECIGENGFLINDYGKGECLSWPEAFSL